MSTCATCGRPAATVPGGFISCIDICSGKDGDECIVIHNYKALAVALGVCLEILEKDKKDYLWPPDQRRVVAARAVLDHVVPRQSPSASEPTRATSLLVAGSPSSDGSPST